MASRDAAIDLRGVTKTVRSLTAVDRLDLVHLTELHLGTVRPPQVGAGDQRGSRREGDHPASRRQAPAGRGGGPGLQGGRIGDVAAAVRPR